MSRSRHHLAIIALILGVAAYSVASTLPDLHGHGARELSIRSADIELGSAGSGCLLCEFGPLPAATLCTPSVSLWLTDAPGAPVDVASLASAQRLLLLPIRGPPVA